MLVSRTSRPWQSSKSTAKSKLIRQSLYKRLFSVCRRENDELSRPNFNVHVFMDYMDVNWFNCFVRKRTTILLTYLFKVIIFLILIFMTTPAAVLETIRFNKIISGLGDALKSESGSRVFNYIFYSYVPPLIVLLVNRLILFLLFWLSKLISRTRIPVSFLFLSNEHFKSCVFLLLFQHAFCSGIVHNFWLKSLPSDHKNIFSQTTFTKFLQHPTR